jgi:hypothetical protein
MYCAGYADGYATASRTREAFDLFNESFLLNEKTGKYDQYDFNPRWHEWFGENIAYVRERIANSTSDYWKRTGLIIAQFDGILNGTNRRASEVGLGLIRELDLWLMQSAGDLDDLEGFLSLTGEVRDPEVRSRCSALVRLAPGNEDLYFAHTTWSDYRDLHAYLKEYAFNVPEFKAKRVSVSTRTGRLGSMDDWWTNDLGLLVFETTLHQFNQTLYKEKLTPKSVLCWIRAYHAMLATDRGKSWTEHFAVENSGTYNNEYLILDTKLWNASHPAPANLLWMIEQMPGTTVSEDVTRNLTQKGYFESINTPQFPLIFNLADYPGQQKREPLRAGFFSMTDQIREKLIVRDAPHLNTYTAFQDFMRYNDYKHDPLMIIPNTTQAEPAQGILSRYDLRPPNGTNWGARRHFGGLDAKTASVNTWLKNHSWDARLSPTSNKTRGIAPFNFSDWPAISHHGIPAFWDFGWTEFPPGDLCARIGKKTEGGCIDVKGCGFCISTQKCLSGTADGPAKYFGTECEVGWTYKNVPGRWVLPTVICVSVAVIVFVIVAVAIHAYRASKRRELLGQFDSI